MSDQEIYKTLRCAVCRVEVLGRRALAFHKAQDCRPPVEKPPEPCTCFKGKRVQNTDEGTIVEYEYGRCQQHEGDAW